MNKLAVTLFGLAVASCAHVPRGDRAEIKGAPGSCKMTVGQDKGMILAGRVIVDGGDIRNTALYVSGGLVAATASESTLIARFPSASVIECANAVISPGLINAHEHNAFSYKRPDVNTQPVYVHRDEWREGLNGKYKLITPAPTADPAILAWVELRHLLSGVTTMAGSGIVAGLTKNVSKPVGQPYVVDLQTFPFKMDAMTKFAPYCTRPPAQWPTVDLSAGVPEGSPYVPHVGEGTSCEAKLEIDAYLDYASKHRTRSFSLVHGVPLSQNQLSLAKKNDVSLVWSPRSNLALYGQSVDATWLLDEGVNVAIGTDWSPSGSFNLFEEMRCGLQFSRAKAHRVLQGNELWRMATRNAAIALGIDDQTGSLEIGKAADIVILDGEVGAHLENFAAQSHENVIAVVIDGRLTALDDGKFSSPNAAFDCPNVVGKKRLCVDFGQYGFTFEEMKNRNHNSIDLFAVEQQLSCSVQ
jgi:cytosine/adenosine deaminase-related metal-dependent hydrolase